MEQLVVVECAPQEGRLVLAAPGLDFDNAEALAGQLFLSMGAMVTTKQTDADLHSWQIDFEGCPLFVRAEHYSSALWIEGRGEEGQEVLAFLAGWLGRQLA